MWLVSSVGCGVLCSMWFSYWKVIVGVLNCVIGFIVYLCSFSVLVVDCVLKWLYGLINSVWFVFGWWW